MGLGGQAFLEGGRCGRVAGQEHAVGGFGGGGFQGGAVGLDGREGTGREEFGQDQGEGLAEVGRDEAGGRAAGAVGGSEGLGAGGQEVGLADAGNGTKGDAEGEVVHEAGPANVDHRDGEGLAEGPETAGGEAERAERREVVVLGVQAGVGAEGEDGEWGTGGFCLPGHVDSSIVGCPPPFLPRTS